VPKLYILDRMFERTKFIHGREYKYLVRNERQGDAVIQKVVKYLGPLDPVYAKEGKKIRRSNAWLFVRPVTESENKMLNTALASSSAFMRDRARIILSSLVGEQCKEISGRMGCDIRKVRNAIHAFNTKGLKALQKEKAKGAEPKFTKEQRAEMLMVASTDPKMLDLHFTTWSLTKLQKYFKEKKIVDSISIESIRLLMKSEGIKIKKSKRFQYSNDPDFAKKNY
jgi:transposase